MSVAFNAGGIVGGGVMPVLAQVLAEGLGAQVGLPLSAPGAGTLGGVMLARPWREAA